MFTHISQLNLLQGASPAAAPTTLTDQDIANIKIACRDAVWEAVIDGPYTAEQCVRLIGSSADGLVSGMDSKNPVFKSQDGSKDRISYITDQYGNRLSRIDLDITL